MKRVIFSLNNANIALSGLPHIKSLFDHFIDFFQLIEVMNFGKVSANKSLTKDPFARF